MRSNCLIEALKAKLKNPKQVNIYKDGVWLDFYNKEHPHFYWYNKLHHKYYSFHTDNILTWMGQLWYEGEIIEYIIDDI